MERTGGLVRRFSFKRTILMMHIHSSLRLLPLLALSAVLAGCATSGAGLPVPNVPVAAYRDTIDLSGKLAVTYQKNGQPQHLNGAYTWTQRPGTIDVELFGPLRQTQAVLHVTPQAATLTLNDGKTRSAADIDTLTAQTLGWTLPVSGLRDWLQGHATDARGQPFSASPANNDVVTKDGWRLRFAEWQGGKAADGTPVPMPRRINAERSATAASDELSLTIVIDPAA
jgi:outer membrane lipoprotein LolB